MTEKKTLIVIKSLPFTSLIYYEALRTAAGLWDHKVKVLWMGDGVYAALDRADKTLTGKFLADLPDLDIEMYVDEDALTTKGFTESELVEGAVPANQAKVKELLDWVETSFVF